MDLYIYYRVQTSKAAVLAAQVLTMQARLAKEYGVATALKRRLSEKDGRHTWMEVYLAVPDGFDAILEHATARAGLAELIDGERHTEYFMDSSLCV
jgi:hypothetical protein